MTTIKNTTHLKLQLYIYVFTKIRKNYVNITLILVLTQLCPLLYLYIVFLYYVFILPLSDSYKVIHLLELLSVGTNNYFFSMLKMQFKISLRLIIVNDFQMLIYGENMVQMLLCICTSEFIYLTKGKESVEYPEHWIILQIATDIRLLCVYIHLCLHCMCFLKK